MNHLLNAPPRLSDLRGEDLQLALRERHDKHRESWLASHHRPSRLQEALDGARHLFAAMRKGRGRAG